MSLEYTTAKNRKNPIPFMIDGREFVFTPKKLAGPVLRMLDGDNNVGGVLDWFAEGLTPEDEDFLSKRLADEEDELDIDTILEIVEGLIEQMVGRPTKSRRGLRRSR